MTTPRPHARTRRAAIGFSLAAAGLLMLAGCDPRALIFFLQPNDPMHPPDAPSLRSKKVVILTHATSSAQADFRAVDHEITKEFVKLLRENVRHIEVVEPQKVWDWADAHPSWTDPGDAARAFEADIVIFLEIQEFRVSDPSSPGLFQGISVVNVQIHEQKYPTGSNGKELKDKPKESEMVWESVVTSEFPNRGHMPEDNVSRTAFKNKFVKLVATEISWHFIGRAMGDDIQDTKL
jgi:hypothetical protein